MSEGGEARGAADPNREVKKAAMTTAGPHSTSCLSAALLS